MMYPDGVAPDALFIMFDGFPTEPVRINAIDSYGNKIIGREIRLGVKDYPDLDQISRAVHFEFVTAVRRYIRLS